MSEKNIKRICEWSGKEFFVDWKHRNQRFIDKNSMYEWRKSQNRETVNCLKCGKPFERYKHILHPRTGKPTQYCSNECNLTSSEKITKLKKWGLSDKNHWNKSDCQKKVKETKLEKYGDENFNNMDKYKQTMMDKYGVPCNFYLSKFKSNGKRISKFQRELYENLLKQHPDVLLEKYLPTVQKSVDIFIPSQNKIVECYGDYWHCNPNKFNADYFHTIKKMTAKEIWEYDKNRVDLLKNAGYDVEIVWENNNKKFKH
jgi:hypothetical protein